MAEHRHPAHFFIKYLMTLGTRDSADDGWVGATVASYTTHNTSPDILRDARREVLSNQPGDFRPRDKHHRESMKYLRSQQVFSLHFPGRSIEIMQENILHVPTTRGLVEQLLLGRLEPKYIANRLNIRHRLLLTPRAVSLYMHFFFNVELLGMDDWEYFLRASSEGETRLAIARVGAPLALYRAGVRQQIESKTIIKKAQSALFMTLLEVDQLPLSTSKVDMLSRLTNTLLRVDERLSQSDLALKEVLAEFERFRIRKREKGAAPISIDQLSPDGAFTGSGRIPQLPERTGVEED